MSGETRGLRNMLWYEAPATESDAPMNTAESMRGRRMFQKIVTAFGSI